LNSELVTPHDRKRDMAARAGWLYYVAGNTQEEIAGKLGVSRQAAQRLVATAVSEKLIKFRLDHPLAECMALAERLKAAFGLVHCEVTPTDPAAADPHAGLGVAAAVFLDSLLSQRAPAILGFSTGRTMRAMVSEVSPMRRPDHRIVTIVGTMDKDGRVSPFDVAMRLADRIGARCYPLPAPVVAGSSQERELAQAQASFKQVAALAAQAQLQIVGLAEIGWQAPMHRDGFLTDDEIGMLVRAGAVGEIAGWPFDGDGVLVRHEIVSRLGALPLAAPPVPPRIAVAGGRRKLAAIRAALHGSLLSGLITDELTAKWLVEAAAQSP